MCVSDNPDIPHEGRRAFIAGSIGIAGTAMAPALAQEPTPMAMDRPPTRVLDDARAVHGPVTFKHNGQPTFGGYLARPRDARVYPAVVVIAGNRISEEYIPNTCAALALAGYVGLAPDIFHILPPSAETLDQMRAASARHTDDDVLQDIGIGIDFLRGQNFVRKCGFGALGFCYGGRIAMMLGARSREIDSVVAYHPGRTTAAQVSRLKGPVQIHIRTADESVPLAEIRELEGVLKKQRTPVEVNLYEGAQHGFLAYTRPPRYKADAAILSWDRTTGFLRRTLK